MLDERQRGKYTIPWNGFSKEYTYKKLYSQIRKKISKTHFWHFLLLHIFMQMTWQWTMVLFKQAILDLREGLFKKKIKYIFPTQSSNLLLNVHLLIPNRSFSTSFHWQKGKLFIRRIIVLLGIWTFQLLSFFSFQTKVDFQIEEFCFVLFWHFSFFGWDKWCFCSWENVNNFWEKKRSRAGVSFRTFIDTKVLKVKVQPSGICIFLKNEVWHQMPEFQTTMENLFQKWFFGLPIYYIKIVT